MSFIGKKKRFVSSNVEVVKYQNFLIFLGFFGNLKLEKENTTIDTEKVKQGGGMIK